MHLSGNPGYTRSLIHTYEVRPVKFYDNPLVLINSRCGSPSCGLLHPTLVEAECAGLILWDDEPEALAVMIQKKVDPQTGRPVYLAVIMEPVSFGNLGGNNVDSPESRLCIIANEDQAPGRHAMALDNEDLEVLKGIIEEDQAYIYDTFFQKTEFAQQPQFRGVLSLDGENLVKEEVDGGITADDELAQLDPEKMFKA